jgi:hypothetical protein
LGGDVHQLRLLGSSFGDLRRSHLFGF